MYCLCAPTEQQYFDIEKRLAECQEELVQATRQLQKVKEENQGLGEFLLMNQFFSYKL